MKKRMTYLGLLILIVGLVIISGPRADNVTIEPSEEIDKVFVNIRIEFLESNTPLTAMWSVKVGEHPPDTFSVYKGFLLDYAGSNLKWNPGDSIRNGSVDILFPRNIVRYLKK